LINSLLAGWHFLHLTWDDDFNKFSYFKGGCNHRPVEV
jgi:hypothetical protein